MTQDQTGSSAQHPSSEPANQDKNYWIALADFGKSVEEFIDWALVTPGMAEASYKDKGTGLEHTARLLETFKEDPNISDTVSTALVTKLLRAPIDDIAIGGTALYLIMRLGLEDEKFTNRVADFVKRLKLHHGTDISDDGVGKLVVLCMGCLEMAASSKKSFPILVSRGVDRKNGTF